MAYTALQVVQYACQELGLPTPSAAAGATDQQTIQMFALLNKVGESLATDHEWQRLSRSARVVTSSVSTTGTVTSGSVTLTGLASTTGVVALDSMAVGSGIPRNLMVTDVPSSSSVTLEGAATASGSGVALTFPRVRYDLPTDFGRIVNRTQWDYTNRWELAGPQSAQGWSWFRGGLASIGPRLRFRVQQNKLVVDPAPANGLDLRYEYQSANWVGAFAASRFTADAQTCVFRDRLMVAGLKLEFFRAKGFDVTTLQLEFDNEMSKAQAQEEGAPILNLAAGARDLRLLSTDQLPDSGYGQ